jgi:predicted nucleotidyltransferase
MNIYNVVVATQLWAKNESIINKCYLYGSRISGQNSSDSDLDVAILINYKGSKEEEL